jgi:hypothetical protein
MARRDDVIKDVIGYRQYNTAKRRMAGFVETVLTIKTS